MQRNITAYYLVRSAWPKEFQSKFKWEKIFDQSIKANRCQCTERVLRKKSVGAEIRLKPMLTVFELRVGSVT